MPKSKSKQTGIEINEQFQRALDMMERTGNNVFITGRAGTGKSTLLEYFRTITMKKVAVLAPTGVAALNVKGQTIHSFFKFKPDITLQKVKRIKKDDDHSATIYEKLDSIVIDEISMVRADLLDCVDKFLRLNGQRKNTPFGGIQMIFVGDLYQLPPVVKSDEKAIFSVNYETPYFFSAQAFEHLKVEFIELEKIYRQHDDRFIDLLNAIRNNSITEAELKTLNRRYIDDYKPPQNDFYIYLTTTNKTADLINAKQLETLHGDIHLFTGTLEGDFGKESLPTAIELQLKVGAQIMMLNNDAAGRWVNGTIGKVTGIETIETNDTVIIAELANGDTVTISPYTWEIFKFFIKDAALESEIVGRFTQYPLMLAWAVTIHKGQGKTFEKVIIDIGRGTFAHGQMYVALSRCTRLDGIVLKQPVLKKHIWMDYRVVKFLTKYQYSKADKTCSVDDKVGIIQRAIENGAALRIVYLKPNDEKSKRVIEPRHVGEMEYNGVKYIGIRAFCHTRKEDRTFRVDRILEIEEV
ncbi:MAG TPA: AAA family ATPase [Dehalococcoidia bacterium]|nr:AAA family ATPase [Dehalococcoidia bacterium]